MSTINDTPGQPESNGDERVPADATGDTTETVTAQSTAAPDAAPQDEPSAAMDDSANDAATGAAGDSAALLVHAPDAGSISDDAASTDAAGDAAFDADADADGSDAGENVAAVDADVQDGSDDADPDDDLFAGLEPDARGMSRMLLDEQIALLIVDAGLLMPASEFIRAVRAEAGFRVSPREISVAAEQLVAGRRPLTVTSVAELVAAGRGTRSERQQRHADDWRTFGALLLVRNLDGSPEGQREFIAQARRVAGARGTDLLLLRTALAVGNMRQALTPDLVGKVAQALSRIWQDLSAEGFVQAAQRTARRIDRENRRPMRGGSVQMDPNVRRTKRKKRSQR